MIFTAAQLAELDGRFPDRDVPRMATACDAKHQRTPFRDPFAVLVKWLENAEANDTDRRQAHATPAARERNPVLGTRSDPEYAAFRMGLIFETLANGLSPQDVIGRLAVAENQFPGVSLHAEVNDLGSLAEDWRPMESNAVAHHVAPEECF